MAATYTTVALAGASYGQSVTSANLGIVHVDASTMIVGSPEQMRALADQLLEVADRVEWSASEVLRRAEERELWERDRQAAREAAGAARLPDWERAFLAGGDVA